MKHERLFNLLLEQVENLKELHFTLKLQQECLVKNNREILDETTRAASVFTQKINKLQPQITTEIKEIDSEFNMGLKTFRLSELIKVYSAEDPEGAKKLALVRKHMLTYINELGNTNFQNSFLIEHSRQLIKSVLTTAASAKNAIIDRRM